jgi:hypothetical protein
MLGAALGLIMPWAMVPLALTLVLLAGTGLATRALARQALADAPATLAGCFAIFSGYTLFTAYERTAFGELAGGIWIPLLLLFALRSAKAARPAVAPERGDSLSIGGARSFTVAGLVARYPTIRAAFDGSAFPLALVVAGAWLSNAPLGVMACYLLAFIALATAVVGRCWAPLLRAAVSVGLGIALAAFFLAPAAWEQRWVAINQATDDPGERIENSFLFSRHTDPSLQFHDLELHRVSLLAVSMVAAALIGLSIAWRRGKLPLQRRWWVSLAGIPLVILFLVLPISLPLWNLLPKLRFLQFPWRWLVALEAPMGIFVAAAIWPGKAAPRKLQPVVAAACILLFLGASLFATRNFFQVCDDGDAVSGMVSVYRSGAGFPGADEYFPQGSDSSVILQSGQPDGCLGRVVLGADAGSATPALADPSQTVAHLVCEASFASTSTRPEQLHIVGSLPHAGDLILRRIAYPAWRVKLNGREVNSHTLAEIPLMVIPVAKGPIDLTVDWAATRDVIFGRWISALAVLLLTALCALERKSGRAHLS